MTKEKQRIVVAQRADLAAPLVALLEKRGAHALQVPVCKWAPPPNPARFDKIVAKANARSYDWILFSNPHTVHFFFERYRELFGDVRGLAGTRLGAYGPMTGQALRSLRLNPAMVAADHKTRLILGAIAAVSKTGSVKAVKGRRFLVVRGNARHATEDVPRALKKAGARADVLQGYAVVTDTRDLTSDAADMLNNGADWLVFASAMAIKHFDRRFGMKKLLSRFPGIRAAVTNKTLVPALKKAGMTPSVIARPNDPRDLVEKICGYLK